ncbi:MAG TPA: dethiobiotin synthase [Verrucomicrobiae bacterium]|nr:dethiobiotin synthase [Verrucomicrobiae bacterium]
MKRYLIAGSDTAVGKTWVTCRLLEALRAAGAKASGFKPIACGDRTDAVALLAAADEKELTIDAINPWFFNTPASPYTAAVIEGRRADMGAIDAALERVCALRDPVLIETAGGLMSPVSELDTMRDLAIRWSCPVIIVVPNRLGALTQALANAECARAAGIDLAAIVLNDLPEPPGPERFLNLEGLRQSNFAVLDERHPKKTFRSNLDSLNGLARLLRR